MSDLFFFLIRTICEGMYNDTNQENIIHNDSQSYDTTTLCGRAKAAKKKECILTLIKNML